MKLYGVDTEESIQINLDEVSEEVVPKVEEIKEKLDITTEKAEPKVTTATATEGVRGDEVSVAIDNQITEVIENTNSENIIEQKENIFKSIAKPLNTSEARKSFS